MEEQNVNTVQNETVPVQAPASYANQTNGIPENYKPISMWGYFGYELLFSIPCIGFILLCVFAFGGTQNVNLKNFARSYFCLIILGIVLLLIVFLVFGSIFAAAMGSAASTDMTSSISGY